ncbi:MAG: acyl-CoA dehydrogenase domain-containing protein [Candidatus Rokubacteria bacterium CSP1-6]|nr:MAG: acyl-CoA dehydrogenase domain-containing protein [Candidatus Rokubacteria bacterium CSP1-6]
MEFDFTPEQAEFRRSVVAFCEKEIVPIAARCDASGEFPLHLFPLMGRLGYLGVKFPPEYGGAGEGNVTYAILAEELGRASAGIALGFYVHVALALTAIAAFGTPAQKERYLRPGIAGEKIGAWAFAEPGAGSDPGSITCRAEKTAAGYRVTGTKMFITNSPFADFVVLTASTAPGQGVKGLSLFIVDKGLPGFTVGRRIETLGMRASQTAELAFDGCVVPLDALLGEENRGAVTAMQTLTLGRITAAAYAVGASRAALDATLEYVKQRQQFGQPVGKFQGVQWMLADMATALEAARLLTYQAAWLADRGLPHIKEVSMAKLFATETATRLANDALQLHGGYGYVMESPIQRLYRDVKLFEIGEGTSQIHRNIIARQLGL